MTPDDRRTRILDAAEELFAEDGYDATPTARIADEASVPKGLVFYYFPHKIDLLLTLLQERLPAPARDVVEGVVRRGDPAGSLLARGSSAAPSCWSGASRGELAWRMTMTCPPRLRALTNCPPDEFCACAAEVTKSRLAALDCNAS